MALCERDVVGKTSNYIGLGTIRPNIGNETIMQRSYELHIIRDYFTVGTIRVDLFGEQIYLVHL